MGKGLGQPFKKRGIRSADYVSSTISEVNANAYYENPEDWERNPADMGPDYSNVIEVDVTKVSQFPTPSSVNPSFMYISEVLTSSVPVNRVYASLVDADDEPDRLSTENLRRAILKGHFDYVREVADMSITGVPVEGLSSSQQRAHDAAIATRKPWKPTLPAFLRHYVKPVILVGDTKQLEATVKSETCATARFGQSLVERLQSLKHPVYMLETQYRMDPRIAEFSSGQFYDEWLMDSAFVQTYNPSWYTNPEFSPAQKHLLDELLEDALASIQHRSEISVNTVDGFQKAKNVDVIILSLVRVEHVSWVSSTICAAFGPALEALGGFYSHCHKRGFVKVVDERGKDAGSGALMVDAGKEGAGWDGRICTDMLADDEHEKVGEEDLKHGNNNRGGDLMNGEADQSLLDAWSASFDD
ncbi:hypothetical protein HDU78_011526 [Chytriomyces hyalinus]|nr:hypothetical protein HDU78_011526 [Chytriomyces hyalinus]